MSTDRAADGRNRAIETARRPGGVLLAFPDRRAFGPFSGRAIRAATVAVLVLLTIGAIVQIFFGRPLRGGGAPPARLPVEAI